MTSRVAVALLAVSVLAGCGSSGGGSSSSAGGSTAAPPIGSSAVQPVPTPATEPAPWPAPSDPMGLTAKAGLASEPAEVLEYHVHAHLDVFVNGKPETVPAGLGIDTKNPAVRQFQLDNGAVGYGLAEPCQTPCISPLHTHDPSGIIHTESATAKPHLLGQFFTQWDVTLNANCVGGYCKPADPITIYVDGKPTTGDPTQIELANGREIAIVIGPPPAIVPDKFDPSAA
jgi:hypothetical protein